MNAVVESSTAESVACRRFNEDGFQILENVVSKSDCDALKLEFKALFRRQQRLSRRTVGGVRNVLRLSPLVADFAASPKLLALVSDLTSRRMFPVRAICFDKIPSANWGVPWHQDLLIAVAERIDTPGFGPWSIKEGVVHVQPPASILGAMITVRLHLDDCYADNGALRVIPGSHLRGELDTDAIAWWTTRRDPLVCKVSTGGALLMRPLLLHASSGAKQPSNRRVLHVEYAAGNLPNGLRWFDWT